MRCGAAGRARSRRQYAVDDAAGVGKRARTQLSEAFVHAYEGKCLNDLDARAFFDEFAAAGPVVLFCVEREPEACHRGLVAKKLAAAGATVTHLRP